MDVAYALIGFTLGLVAASIISMIGRYIITMSGISLYPLIYNSYQTAYNQLPKNATNLQIMVYNTFQNSVAHVSQTTTYAVTTSSTLVAVSQIAIFIGVFIILLELLMRLAMPRTTVVAPAGY